MIRKMLAAIGLVALMIGTANAEPKTKLPKAFLGEWCFDTKTETYRRAPCRQSDGWLNVRPGGFSAHETDCTLQSASPNRSGEYRTQFECRGEGMIWTAYYWIGLDARDPRRLDSTFTKTEPDPSERNERLEDGTGSPARLPDEVLGDWCPIRDPRCAVTDPMAIRSSGTMTTFDGGNDPVGCSATRARTPRAGTWEIDLTCEGEGSRWKSRDRWSLSGERLTMNSDTGDGKRSITLVRAPNGPATMDEWKALASEAISRHARYPREAGGESGVVKVHFGIDRLGRLTRSDISVSASSGNPALDAEALTIVKDSAPLPPLPPGSTTVDEHGFPDYRETYITLAIKFDAVEDSGEASVPEEE